MGLSGKFERVSDYIMIFNRGSRITNPFRISVKKKGLKRSLFKDIYHLVLAASWFEFFFVNTTLYLSLNLFFASLYCVGGNNILNSDGSLWDAFVFSFQTSATIGYG